MLIRNKCRKNELLLLFLLLFLLLLLLLLLLGPHKAVAAGMDARRVVRDMECPVRNTPLAERTRSAKRGGRAGRGMLSFGDVVNLWL